MPCLSVFTGIVVTKGRLPVNIPATLHLCRCLNLARTEKGGTGGTGVTGTGGMQILRSWKDIRVVMESGIGVCGGGEGLLKVVVALYRTGEGRKG